MTGPATLENEFSSLGSSRFARRYSGNLYLIYFPPLTEMFHFSGSRFHDLCIQSWMMEVSLPGCPIRIFPGQCFYPAHRNFSQVTSSFFACRYQGIHQQPLAAWPHNVFFTAKNYYLRQFLHLTFFMWSISPQAPFYFSEIKYKSCDLLPNL